jgi:hypothetical protein
MKNLLCREKHLQLNDPRCYNGAFYDAEYVWGPWGTLAHDVPEAKQEDTLYFWKSLNDYAVAQRGESARREFKYDGS